MRVREATPKDAYDMGLIQADCDLTDAMARFFAHRIEEYPTSHRIFSSRFCKQQAFAPGAIAFIAETEPSDYDPDTRHRAPEVAAFTVWHRFGTEEAARKWTERNTGVWSMVGRWCVSAEDKYLDLFPRVRPTFRPENMAKLLQLLTVPLDKEVFSEAWDLDLLFVSPRWQRRGLARMLMQWGFDRATEEKVPVILKSSALGGPVYRRMGFRPVGELGMKALFDTTEYGGEEPQFWCWEPEECKGMWYEKGKESWARLRAKGGGSVVAAVAEEAS